MSKFELMESELNRYIAAVNICDIDGAMDVLKNKLVLRALANNSESTRANLFKLGYCGNDGEQIFNLLVSNMTSNKKERILESGDKELNWQKIMTYVQTHPIIKNEMSHDLANENSEWFINTVLPDLLTSEKPNYKNLIHISPDLYDENITEMDYYKAVFMFAKENNVNAFRLVECMANCSKYMYYFMACEELSFIDWFFDRLSKEEINELTSLILSVLKSKIDVDDILNMVILLTKIHHRGVLPEFPIEKLEAISAINKEIKIKTKIYNQNKLWLKNETNESFYKKEVLRFDNDKKDIDLLILQLKDMTQDIVNI